MHPTGQIQRHPRHQLITSSLKSKFIQVVEIALIQVFEECVMIHDINIIHKPLVTDCIGVYYIVLMACISNDVGLPDFTKFSIVKHCNVFPYI